MSQVFPPPPVSPLPETIAPEPADHGARAKQGNKLLASLPAETQARLQPLLSRVQLVSGQVLYERGALIEHAYFIEAGMVSSVSGTDDHELGVEVGIAGHEGLVGCIAMFEPEPYAFCRTVVQMAGSALRIRTADLSAAADTMPALRRLGVRYLQALLAQAAQSVACNAIHALPQRAARWMLVAYDFADMEDLTLTQEFLSNMLGVTRPGVSLVAKSLQDAGVISYRRGHLKVVDRAGLERAACGCYRIVRREYDRLLDLSG